MQFSKNLGLQLYVEDVLKEKEFYQAIGFEIITVDEMMGYEYVTLKTCAESSVLFTIFSKDFIKQVSPEVLDMTPSILFETNDILALHQRVSKVSQHCSQINDKPFPNFNFKTPSGMYFAVKEVNE